MMDILLASQSKYKRKLFEQLNLKFMTASPLFDEDNFDKSQITPGELSRKMSYLKGKDLAEKYPHKIIISADQVCLVENTILSKPGSAENAFSSLKRLRNKTHELMTSYTLFYQGKVMENTVIAKLKMRNLSDSQILKYIELDKPLDCAGSYKLESFGITLFKSVEMSDHTSIVGLPLISLAKDLESLGVVFFE